MFFLNEQEVKKTMELEEEWKQTSVVHCQGKDCKGMLLSNDFKHYVKCSDCKKCYMEITKYVEIDEKEFIHQTMY